VNGDGDAMARGALILGIWVLAAAFGSLGYQVLDYYFYDRWPPLSVAFVWGKLFGPWPSAANEVLHAGLLWCGRLPVLAVGIVLAYLCFLVSDTVRRPLGAARPLPGE
jgi:hypothetical protein